MKKEIIILLFFSIQATAQNPKFPHVKIAEPCTQQFIDNYNGKWLIPPATLFNSPAKDFSQGAMKKLQDIQELMIRIYPQPMGADGYWSGGYSKTYFADKVKYVTEDGQDRMEYVSANPVSCWHYQFVLFPWYCDDSEQKQVWNGYPDAADGTGVRISANNMGIIVNGTVADDNIMTINQQQIKYKMPIIGEWKGYNMMNAVAAELQNNRYLLISRRGMLPYIPVTRKQYIDKATAYVTKFYDGIITNADKSSDKEEADAMKKSTLKIKDEAIQKYKEALIESEKGGLLDSPAIVLYGPLGGANVPIFATEAEGGRMLVIDNPDYFRKDLPGYVPQLFVIEWNWGKLKSSTDFRKAFEDNFLIGKLQEMIDK
jgi:hypothetical protein